jgi:DnaJ domain
VAALPPAGATSWQCHSELGEPFAESIGSSRIRGAVSTIDSTARALRSSRVNHYELLGVPVDASTAEVRSAFRTKAHRHHPDRCHGASSEAQVKATTLMRQLNQAWGVLGTADSRHRYDLTLNEAAQAKAGHVKAAYAKAAQAKAAQAKAAQAKAAQAKAARERARATYRPVPRSRRPRKPRASPEFVCQSCMLLKHHSQLVDVGRMWCRDCV